jgi:hypothetical protein
MASTAEAAAGAAASAGLFDATMLVAGTMIGSGIFIVSADIARTVGSAQWLLFVWVLTGVITVIGALSYAELAAMMPQAGGQYVYLREAYGPLWGFLYGWTCSRHPDGHHRRCRRFAKFTGRPGACARAPTRLLPGPCSRSVRSPSPRVRPSASASSSVDGHQPDGRQEGKWAEPLHRRQDPRPDPAHRRVDRRRSPEVRAANYRGGWGEIFTTAALRRDQRLGAGFPDWRS